MQPWASRSSPATTGVVLPQQSYKSIFIIKHGQKAAIRRQPEDFKSAGLQLVSKAPSPLSAYSVGRSNGSVDPTSIGSAGQGARMEHGSPQAPDNDVAGMSLGVRDLNVRSLQRDAASPLGGAINLSDDSPGMAVTEPFLRSARIYILKNLTWTCKSCD